MYTKTQKARARLLLLLLVCATLFSALYMVGQADHECSVEGCPICVNIHQMEQLFKTLGTAAAASMPCGLLITLSVLILLAGRFARLPYASLIVEKIRMND